MPCLVWLPDRDRNAFWGEPAPTCVGGALGASLLDGAMVLTAGVLIIFLGSSIRWYLLDVRPRTPRTDRQWIEALRTQPTVRFDGSMATIHGVRDFSWHTSRSFDARWFDASYDLEQITEIRYLVSEFSRFRGLAHTMLDFRFENGRSLTFSFEVRCEVGETYSPWKGLWRNYELILVIGTTEDVVRLRTNASKGCVVRSYRAIPSAPGKAAALFRSLCERANELSTNPVWYHSVKTTCTTAIIDEVNRVTPGRVPFTWRAYLPGYSARIAHRIGLIEDHGGLRSTMARSRIDGDLRGIDDREAWLERFYMLS